MDLKGDSVLKVGVVLSDISDYYQQEILSGSLAAAEGKNIRIIALNDRQPEQLLDRTLEDSPVFRRINTKNVDVLIFLTAVIQHRLKGRHLREYIGRFPDIPKISLGVPFDDIPTIETDNRAGMEKITRHVIEKHHCRKIAYLNGPKGNLEVKNRFEGFKSVMEASSIPYDPLWVYQGDFTPGNGKAAVKYLLDEKKLKFDAVICVDDYTAFEVIDSLQSRGIAVPEDCLVTGFDNVEHSEFSSPGLTTVHQPLFEMGFEGVMMAEKLSLGKEGVKNRKIELALVVRESCSCRIPMMDISEGPGKEKPFSQKECKEALQSHINQFEKKEASESTLFSLRLNTILLQLLKSAQIYGEQLDDSFFSQEIHKIVAMAARNRLNGFTLIRALSPLFKGFHSQSRMNYVWDRLRFYLLVSDNHLSGMEKLTRQQRLHILSTSLDFSIGGVTGESMRKKIFRCVKSLGIRNMFVLIYNPESEKMAPLLALREGKQITPPSLKLDPFALYPWKSEQDREQSYFFLPLYSKDNVLGYLFIESQKLSFPLYVDLLYRITSGVEGIFLMEKINRYTEHLEEEISLRTGELEKANRQLKALSFNDPLTGLKNRRYLDEVLKPQADHFLQDYLFHSDKVEKRAERPSLIMAAYILDIDHFKEVNDLYGHDSGDKVIQGIAKVLLNSTRARDSVIRMGGEEFLIILQGINREMVLEKAEEIRNEIKNEKFNISQGKTISVTCSFGCLPLPAGREKYRRFSLEETIILIDQALYHAKETGRDKSVTLEFSSELAKSELSSKELVDGFDHWVNKNLIRFIPPGDRG